MRDPMPTAAQAVVLLNVLAQRYVLAGVIEVQSWIDVLVAEWVDNRRYPPSLTPAGRDALARYLLRTFADPAEMVSEQPPMKHDEARVMLAIVTCREFKAPTELLGYLSLRRWVGLSRVSRGELVATTSGREALISYLLRDFHA